MRYAYAIPAMLLMLAAAGCSDGSANGNSVYPTADAPLVAPPTPNNGSGSTLSRQQGSGYYPNADAPLVPPNNPGNAGTPEGPQGNAAFPAPDSPLSPKNPSQPQ